MKNEEITVFLAPLDVDRFKEFQKHYELFNFLLSKKVFEQKGAAITINFDIMGQIGSITRADVLYLSNKQFDNKNEKVL